MKTALIIGISGQDGSYLAKLLLEKKYNVVGTSRDHEVSSFTNLKKLGIFDEVTLTSMDTSDFRSVITALSKYKPDEIYNLAGQTSVGMSFKYPVETFNSILIGSMNLLECVRILNHPVRLYNAGSGEVFGNITAPANEKTPFSPLSPYATAKAAASYAVANYREAYGMYACSGILFNHESPLRPVRFVTKKIIDSVIRINNGSNEKIKLGNLNVTRDWGWAPDYVEAMWLMLAQKEPEDYIIATGYQNTLEDFLNISFEYFKLNWRDHVITDAEFLRPLDVQVSSGDPSKAKAKLGWEPKVSFNQMIEKLLRAELF